ncbi:MAG TPA: AAA family ATPase [Caldisericia bacterium]|nr:AAA family ATPase [Caldisericia bacterium]
MRVKSIFIDQFGGYEKTKLEFLPGFSLFFGSNESGKTTLRHFFQQMLFGFPKKATNSDRIYSPFSGGKPSGTMNIVSDTDQEYQIQRQDQKVSILHPDQTVSNREIDHSLWNGIDRETFRQIFCMDIKDWNGLSFMNKEEMQNRFLSASYGVRSLSHALGQLQKQYKEILTPGGRVQVLNKLHKELKETNKKIRDRALLSSEYIKWNEEISALNKQIEEMQQTIKELEKETTYRALWNEMKNDWGRYQTIRTELDQYPAIFSSLEYSESILEKAQRLDQEIQDMQESLKTIQKNLDTLQQEYNSIQIHLNILEIAPSIRELIEKKNQFAQALEDYPIISLEKKKKEDELKVILSKIDPQWDENGLQNIFFHTAEEELQIYRWKKEYEKWDQKCQNIEHLVAKLKEDQSNLEHKREKILRYMEEKESQMLSQEDYSSLSIQYQQCKEFQKHLSYEQQKKIESSTKPYSFASSSKTIFLIPYITLLASFFGILLSPSLPLIRNLSVAVGIVSVLVLFFFHFFTRHQRQTNETSFIQKEIESYCKTNNLPLELCSYAGITSLVLSWEKQLEKQRDSEQQITRWKETIQDIDSDLVQISSQMQRMREEQKIAKDQQKEITDQWNNWKQNHHLSNQILIQDADFLFSIMKDAQNTGASLQEFSDRLVLVQNTVYAVQKQLQNLFSQIGEERPLDRFTADSITQLQKLLSDTEESQRRKNEIEMKIAQEKNHQSEILEHLANRKNQFNSLLESYHVDHLEQLESQTMQYKRYRTRKEEQETLYQRLYGRVGNEEQWSNVCKILSELDFQDNETQLKNCFEQIENIKHGSNEAVEKRGKLQQRKEDLSSNTEMEQLHQKKESIEVSIHEKAEEWLTSVVAYSLIQQTKSVFEEKQQPGVIRFASQWIYEITDHRYQLMKTSSEEDKSDSFVLFDTTHKRKTEDEWSDGLADQVYLAIRIGLIQELSEHGETLPLFLDDILLRFDVERQRKTARLLLELSDKHQILYFSCHSSLLHLFQSIALENPSQNASFYTIDRFSIQSIPSEEIHERPMAALFSS